MPVTYKHILIIKPSALGDIIMALPALTALRQSFPDAKIDWLVRPEFTSLLQGHPHLTSIIPFDRKYLGKSWYNPKAFWALLKFLRDLNRSDYDIVFDFQGLFRTAFFAWVTGCRKRFGIADSRELAHIFYTHKIPHSQDYIHLVDYYLKIVRAAGACDTDAQFILPQNQKAADTISGLLKSHNVKPDNYFVFVTGSAHTDKCWPVERFAALADRLWSQFGLPIVATGSVSEGQTIEKLKSIAKSPIIDFSGQTSLSELISLLRFSKLVVSNDTGPGHIAAALGKPLVLIFGRSNPARVAPYNRDKCVAAVDFLSRGLKADSPDPRHNIMSITVDDVHKKVCEQITF